MNKVFLGIVLTVCILGMLLVMLNDRLGRKTDSVASRPGAELTAPETRSEEIEAAAKALETAEASKALAPPTIEEYPEFKPDAPSANLEVPAAQIGQPDLMPTPEAPKEVGEPLLPAPPLAKPALQEQKPVSKPEQPAPSAKAETKPAQAPEKAQAPRGDQAINKFVIYSREKGATVRIGSAGKLEYSSMTLTNPDRVVVDLPGSWKFPANPGVPRNDLVSAVRVGQSGNKTRVVIDLKMPARKVVLVPFKAGNGVDVRVDR